MLPNITPFRVVPDENGELAFPSDPFALYVLDGIIPGDLPPADLLLINPPTNPLFAVLGTTDRTDDAIVANHPLTRFVEWNTVHVLRAKQVETPSWDEVLISTERIPLVFIGERSGQRIAVVTFDLHDSDLPLQITYPILFANLINFLATTNAMEAPNGLQPGEAITIRPELDVSEVTIVSPSGQIFKPTLTEDEVFFSETRELGVYTVNYRTGDSPELTESQGLIESPGLAESLTIDRFAVNLFSPEESDIKPKSTIQVGRNTITQSDETELGQREFWPWLATLALLVLIIEWWIYHRRQV